MKKRIILLVLPMLLASCSSSKKIETNKEIKEISTQIATSIKGVDECKAYQYEESSSLIDKFGRLTSSHLIEAADYVNKKAFQGTLLAHVDGGVPNIVLTVPALNAYSFGYMVYFFEKACGISGYLLGVNPFNQPGVEAYKKNMFALLGKPGYEEQKAELEARLK